MAINPALKQVGNVATLRTPVGGPQDQKPSRAVQLYAKDFTQVEQGHPVPLCLGTVKVTGVQFTPIWGFRSRAVKVKQGK